MLYVGTFNGVRGVLAGRGHVCAHPSRSRFGHEVCPVACTPACVGRFALSGCTAVARSREASVVQAPRGLICGRPAGAFCHAYKVARPGIGLRALMNQSDGVVLHVQDDTNVQDDAITLTHHFGSSRADRHVSGRPQIVHFHSCAFDLPGRCDSQFDRRDEGWKWQMHRS